MASDLLIFANEKGKEFKDLKKIIEEMMQEGVKFSFDEVKTYTKLTDDDAKKIEEKIKGLIQKKSEGNEVKTVKKDGKKFKVRKRVKKAVKPKEEIKTEEKPKQEMQEVVKENITTEKKEENLKSPKENNKISDKEDKTENNEIKDTKKTEEQKNSVKMESKDENVVVKEEISTLSDKEKVEAKATDGEKENKKIDNQQNENIEKSKNIPDNKVVKETEEKIEKKSKSEEPKIEKEKAKIKKPTFNNAVIVSKSKKVYDMKNEKPDKSYSSSKKDYKKSSEGHKPRKKVIHITPEVMNEPANKHSKKRYEPKNKHDEFSEKKKKKEKRKNNQKTKIYNSAQLEAMEMDGYEVSKKRKKVKKKQKKVFKTTEITVPKASKRIIKLTNDSIVIADLAKEMNVKAAVLIQNLFKLGMMATINQSIDIDTATLLANEFGYDIQLETFDAEKIIQAKLDEKGIKAEKKPRAPIVTVMGHVDHGKTKLLDAIRKTNVIDTEAGGITQHIGAYRVKTEGGYITFLDTPGHEAFTSMRARGANVTDIVVLIVAADDGIMPQTVEAINHAQAAGVPIIVAINKIDKPGINIPKIKEELTAYNLVSEDWGGDTIICEISAKKEIGIDNLLENILLQAEMLELEAAEDIPAKATVIEAFIDKGRGAVTNALIQEGHLSIGDFVVAGEVYGKVRAMFDDNGNKVDYAGPSMPVSILGLNGVPKAGEPLLATNDEKTAKQIANHYAMKQREEELKRKSMLSAENLFQQLKESEMKELRIIVKADVQGSVEAVKNVLLRLTNEEVKVNVIHAAVGPILENDINLAMASNALIVGFNVRVASAKVKELAEKNGIEIRLYSIIYNMEEDIERLTKGMLEPIIKEVILGHAEVLKTFNVPKVGTVAGCMVKKGKILRNSNVRLIRDGVVIADDTLKSLKRFKDDVKEVKEGFECGLGLQKYNDIKPGDIIESYMLEEEKQ